MFRVLWKNKAQLFKKESLPRHPGPDSTLCWIFLVYRHLGTSIPSPWGRQAGHCVWTRPRAGLRLPPTETAGLK